jgi:hypothetical protein
MEPRKKPLITHVEDDLERAVKTLADEAGMTASSYIRRVLKNHVDSPAVQKVSRVRRSS